MSSNVGSWNLCALADGFYDRCMRRLASAREFSWIVLVRFLETNSTWFPRGYVRSGSSMKFGASITLLYTRRKTPSLLKKRINGVDF